MLVQDISLPDISETSHDGLMSRKAENHWPSQGPDQILPHPWFLPGPLWDLGMSPSSTGPAAVTSFHAVVFFYSYLALSLFFPFLECLYVLIPQLQVETMGDDSHCAFHLGSSQ